MRNQMIARQATGGYRNAQPIGCASMEQTITIDQAPDEVWALVSTSEGLATWLGEEVEIDLVAGGSGLVVDDGEVRHVLVTEVDEGRRVTWHWSGDDGEISTVGIDLVEIAPGTTTVIVTEVRDIGHGYRASARAGLVGAHA
jgi:uncharacterized protein YndB with AHSA1/START domain